MLDQHWHIFSICPKSPGICPEGEAFVSSLGNSRHLLGSGSISLPKIRRGVRRLCIDLVWFLFIAVPSSHPLQQFSATNTSNFLHVAGDEQFASFCRFTMIYPSESFRPVSMTNGPFSWTPWGWTTGPGTPGTPGTPGVKPEVSVARVQVWMATRFRRWWRASCNLAVVSNMFSFTHFSSFFHSPPKQII